MPLSINVGLSRKASRDYQSSGVSINVTAELDQSLLARPAELQQAIGDLYSQAQSALDRQTQQAEPAAVPQAADAARRAVPRPASPALPGAIPGGNGRAAPAMTASQRRAVEAICQRIGLDPDAEAREQLGVEFAGLSLRQASRLIDLLKQVEPAEGRNGGAR